MSSTAFPPPGAAAQPPASPGSPQLFAPSPMEPAGLFTSAYRVIRRAPGLLVGLALLQWLAMLVVIAAVAGIWWASGAAFTDITEPVASTALLAALLLAVAFVAMVLVQLKLSSMQFSVVDQLARGLDPSWSSSRQATRGVVGRGLVLLGLALLAMLAFSLPIAALTAAVVNAVLGIQQDSPLPGAGLIGLALVAMPVMWLVLVWLSTRLIYVTAVLAIEGRSGTDVVRRSWQLTRGRFWPTLGLYLLGMAAPAVISGGVQGALSPLLTAGADPSGTAAADTGMTVLVLAITMLIQLVIQVWQMVYLAVMYVDRVRRDQLPSQAPAPVTGGWPQPTPNQPAPSQLAPNQPAQIQTPQPQAPDAPGAGHDPGPSPWARPAAGPDDER